MIERQHVTPIKLKPTVGQSTFFLQVLQLIHQHIVDLVPPSLVHFDIVDQQIGLGTGNGSSLRTCQHLIRHGSAGLHEMLYEISRIGQIRPRMQYLRPVRYHHVAPDVQLLYVLLQKCPFFARGVLGKGESLDLYCLRLSRKPLSAHRLLPSIVSHHLDCKILLPLEKLWLN